MIDDKKIEAAANKHIDTEYSRYNSGEVEEEMICLRGKYCPDCYEFDEKLDEYVPKKKGGSNERT